MSADRGGADDFGGGQRDEWQFGDHERKDGNQAGLQQSSVTLQICGHEPGIYDDIAGVSDDEWRGGYPDAYDGALF